VAHQRIGVAYATSLLSTISVLLTNLWLLREITDVIDKEAIGLYGLVSQIVTYFWLVQLGLDAAASQAIAAALGRGDPGAANRTYRQLARFNTYGIGVCSVVTALAVATVEIVLRDNFPNTSLVEQLIVLFGLGQVVAFFSRTEVAALGGSQRLATVNVIRLGQSLSSVFLAYLLLKTGWGVRCQPVADLIVQACGYFIFRYAARTACDWYSPGIPFSWDGFRTLARFGMNSSFSGLASVAESVADILVLHASSGGLTAIALFTIWHRFPALLFQFASQLLNSAFPTLSARISADPAAGHRLFLKISHFVVGMSTLFFIGLGIWLPPFIHLWVGGRYDLPDARLLAWLIGAFVCVRLNTSLLVYYLAAGGHTALIAWLTWAQCVLKIGVSVAVVPSFGLVGLYAAYLLASMVPFVGLVAFLVRAGRFDWEFLIRTCVLMSISGGIAAGLGPQTNGTILRFTTGVVVTTVVWCGIVMGWAFATHSRQAHPPLPSA
jgi:Na+-driven multidrug efflux pump